MKESIILLHKPGGTVTVNANSYNFFRKRSIQRGIRLLTHFTKMMSWISTIRDELGQEKCFIISLLMASHFIDILNDSWSQKVPTTRTGELGALACRLCKY